MFCPKCGAENTDTAKFCKNCGQPLPRKAQPARAPKKMSRLIGILMLAVVCVVVVVLVYPRLESMPLPGGTGLPGDIERIIFEESEFTEPITVHLAGGDDPAVYQEYQAETLNHAPAPVHQGWASASGAGWLGFLVKNGYAEVKTVKAQAYIGSAVESKFLFYDESIEPYVLSGSCKPNSYFTLLLARRRLKEIGFTNQYEQLEEKFYAVNFTYTLEEVLPGLSDINKEFEGKAELYWDPIGGTWTLQHVQLEDRSYLEWLFVL